MVSPEAPNFDNSYARLPDSFFSRQSAAAVPDPKLIRLNEALARQLSINPSWLHSEAGLAMLSGNAMPQGATPIATVYAGHQFGQFNPQLGDGRALLIGEVLDPLGQRYDVQLKGSGRTPYSRGGDGKSPLGPVLREYLVSESMHALGVPTTRALAAVTTGETVYRERALPGAILTRVAKSHIRIGTFQYFAARGQRDAVDTLLEHVIARHFPEAQGAAIPALAVFNGVMARQAQLIAQWQGLGFVHGVMNTDNMLLSGETIDYGPCAFMEHYHPGTVFSSIDHHGRYAFANQPAIAQWNLAQLAQALLPLLDDNDKMAVEIAQDALNDFPELFFTAFRKVIAKKLGLEKAGEEDEKLYQEFLELLAQHKCDFTLAFRRLAEISDPDRPLDEVAHWFEFDAAFSDWLARWRRRCDADSFSAVQRRDRMLASNPVFIPRNHLVEAVIRAATDDDDFAPFHRILEVIDQPFQFTAENTRYYQPAKPEEQVLQTFCGT